MTNPFIPADVRAVVTSLDNEPEAWEPAWSHEGKLFWLTNPNGLAVWCSNRPYGVEIQYRWRSLWGGVSIMSSFWLSPGHWALSNAIGRWLKSNPAPSPPPLPSAADALRTSTPGEA